jgi:hypothetical protein
MRRRVRLTRRGRIVFFGLFPAAVLVGLSLGLFLSLREPSVALATEGPDGDVVNAEALPGLSFRAAAPEPGMFARASLTLDGRDITEQISRAGAEVVYRPRDLADGDHELVLRVPRRLSRAMVTVWRFTVDATHPEVNITEPGDVVFANEPVRLAGTAKGAQRLEIAGEAVDLGPDGTFALELDEPPGKALQVVAADAAGNRTEEKVRFTVVRSRAVVDEVRAVHVSFYGWASSLRKPILKMADRGQITAVQLDLKDESGVVGYDSNVRLARRAKAVNPINDLKAAVDELHGRGLYVIGRVVAFRDPVLKDWAWRNGKREYVLQTPGGKPYGGYGGFTNFSHPDVQQYNIDIAKEAAAAGVDSILYDYVRRPDGPLRNLEIPGLSGPPEDAIVEFMKRSAEQLEPYRVDLGASVYGIAATRPTQIAQDIPGIARYADYVSPMVYPSHWGPGEYNVDDPNRRPYDIVHRSLEDFLIAVDGTDCKVIPWLEDTYYRAWNRHRQVREQIRATRDWGIGDFIMWDPHVRYTVDALVANPKTPPKPTRQPGENRDPKVAETARNAAGPDDRGRTGRQDSSRPDVPTGIARTFGWE